MTYGEWLKLTGLSHTPQVFLMWVAAMIAKARKKCEEEASKR